MSAEQRAAFYAAMPERCASTYKLRMWDGRWPPRRRVRCELAEAHDGPHRWTSGDAIIWAQS